MELDPGTEASLRKLEISSTLRDAKQPEQVILREVDQAGYSEEEAFAIKLALEEAMINAVKHGNHSDASKRIIVRYSVTPERAIILVRDQGSGFTPDAVPDPTRPDRLSLPNGRGIMLMRAYMDEISYRECGTEVCMLKRRQAPES